MEHQDHRYAMIAFCLAHAFLYFLFIPERTRLFHVYTPRVLIPRLIIADPTLLALLLFSLRRRFDVFFFAFGLAGAARGALGFPAGRGGLRRFGTLNTVFFGGINAGT